MFTIKQITKEFENIWEGSNPRFAHKGLGDRPTVYFDMAEGGMCSIDAGDVFVMNSAGNTVSKYHLENSPTMR